MYLIQFAIDVADIIALHIYAKLKPNTART